MKKKIALIVLVGLILSSLYIHLPYQPNENYLQLAKEATKPNTNFMFASNASLPGRIYMTFSGKEFKTCINTVTSFFNKYHTCSSCKEFVKNPEEWNFVQTNQPKVGDIIIQHNPQIGIAYHAAIIVNIENGNYYVNHAVRTRYIKNAILKNKEKLTFYSFVSN